jgi:peptidoglycan/xylan/chitin deacetylase (PgdA/CDA1 family)
VIAITIDCEQVEYGYRESTKESFEGNKRLLEILNRRGVPSTFFMTGVFAEERKVQVRENKKKHEIACHGYNHSYRDSKNLDLRKDISKAKKILEGVSGKKVIGFRSPQMQYSDELIKILEELGFKYDSSIHSAYIPFFYGKGGLPLEPYQINKITEIPASSSRTFRFPFSWIVMRNFPLWFIKRIVKNLLKRNIKVIFYVHSWEFYEVKKTSGPLYARYLYSRNTGKKFCKKFERFLEAFRDEEFVVMRELV